MNTWTTNTKTFGGFSKSDDSGAYDGNIGESGGSDKSGYSSESGRTWMTNY